MNHMCKLAHWYHPIVCYKHKSLQMWFTVPYYHKIFIFLLF